MEKQAEILRSLRNWHKRWSAQVPAAQDADGWERLISELKDIIPPTEDAAERYAPIYTRYIEDLERRN